MVPMGERAQVMVYIPRPSRAIVVMHGVMPNVLMEDVATVPYVMTKLVSVRCI